MPMRWLSSAQWSWSLQTVLHHLPFCVCVCVCVCDVRMPLSSLPPLFEYFPSLLPSAMLLHIQAYGRDRAINIVYIARSTCWA